jgi:hypothetical protein
MVRGAHPTLLRYSWAFGPPLKHEKLVLAGGTAFPGCARLTRFRGTGWKVCATTLVGGAGLCARRLHKLCKFIF